MLEQQYRDEPEDATLDYWLNANYEPPDRDNKSEDAELKHVVDENGEPCGWPIDLTLPLHMLFDLPAGIAFVGTHRIHAREKKACAVLAGAPSFSGAI